MTCSVTSSPASPDDPRRLLTSFAPGASGIVRLADEATPATNDPHGGDLYPIDLHPIDVRDLAPLPYKAIHCHWNHGEALWHDLDPWIRGSRGRQPGWTWAVRVNTGCCVSFFSLAPWRDRLAWLPCSWRAYRRWLHCCVNSTLFQTLLQLRPHTFLACRSKAATRGQAQPKPATQAGGWATRAARCLSSRACLRVCFVAGLLGLDRDMGPFMRG